MELVGSNAAESPRSTRSPRQGATLCPWVQWPLLKWPITYPTPDSKKKLSDTTDTHPRTERYPKHPRHDIQSIAVPSLHPYPTNRWQDQLHSHLMENGLQESSTHTVWWQHAPPAVHHRRRYPRSDLPQSIREYHQQYHQHLYSSDGYHETCMPPPRHS